MSKFKAMSFIVNGNLDEITGKLGEIGYQLNFKLTDNPVCVVTNKQGGAGFFDFIVSGSLHYFTNIEDI